MIEINVQVKIINKSRNNDKITHVHKIKVNIRIKINKIRIIMKW